MDPVALLPTPEAIPVPWGWFQALLLLTFLIHILLMNAMFGSAFIGFISYFQKDGVANPCSETVSTSLPFIIAFTVNFGVAPLLFVQVLYGHLFYSSSILMAAYWLSVVGVLVAAYSLSYLLKYRYAQLGWFRVPLLVVIVTLFAAIAFAFVNNIGLMQNPSSWSRYFSEPRGLLLNLEDPMQVPRYLHFVFASVAIGGLSIATYFYWKQTRGDWTGMDWVQRGCRWFGFATMANILLGFWFLVTLPKGSLNWETFSGQVLIATLAIGALAALPAIRAALAGRVVATLCWSLATVLCMVLARDQLRQILLNPWFSPTELKLQPEFTPLYLFLAVLVFGLGLIAWMVPFTLRNCKGGQV